MKALLLLCITLACVLTLPANASANPPIEVYFSPNGGCTEAVVRAIGSAKKSIRVQAFGLTSKPIAAALIEAHKRNVKVEVILDKSQKAERGAQADTLLQAGLPTFIDDKHASARLSTIIIDAETVVTGSFNYTKASEEKNVEDLLVVHDAELAAKYTEKWQLHLSHSVPHEETRSYDRIPRPKLPGQ